MQADESLRKPMKAYTSRWKLMEADESLRKPMEVYGKPMEVYGKPMAAYGSFGYFLKSGLRFSRNARPPSCASSSM